MQLQAKKRSGRWREGGDCDRREEGDDEGEWWTIIEEAASSLVHLTPTKSEQYAATVDTLASTHTHTHKGGEPAGTQILVRAAVLTGEENELE